MHDYAMGIEGAAHMARAFGTDESYKTPEYRLALTEFAAFLDRYAADVRARDQARAR